MEIKYFLTIIVKEKKFHAYLYFIFVLFTNFKLLKFIFEKIFEKKCEVIFEIF